MAQEFDAHEHDRHGQTPAAWTAVTLVIIAFVVGTLGVVLGQYVMVWIGVGLVILGGIVGKVMSMAGLGMPRDKSSHR
jgi:purine-cytosine permease-like protein